MVLYLVTLVKKLSLKTRQTYISVKRHGDIALGLGYLCERCENFCCSNPSLFIKCHYPSAHFHLTEKIDFSGISAFPPYRIGRDRGLILLKHVQLVMH